MCKIIGFFGSLGYNVFLKFCAIFHKKKTNAKVAKPNYAYNFWFPWIQRILTIFNKISKIQICSKIIHTLLYIKIDWVDRIFNVHQTIVFFKSLLRYVTSCDSHEPHLQEKMIWIYVTMNPMHKTWKSFPNDTSQLFSYISIFHTLTENDKENELSTIDRTMYNIHLHNNPMHSQYEM